MTTPPFWNFVLNTGNADAFQRIVRYGTLRTTSMCMLAVGLVGDVSHILFFLSYFIMKILQNSEGKS